MDDMISQQFRDL